MVTLISGAAGVFLGVVLNYASLRVLFFDKPKKKIKAKAGDLFFFSNATRGLVIQVDEESSYLLFFRHHATKPYQLVLTNYSPARSGIVLK